MATEHSGLGGGAEGSGNQTILQRADQETTKLLGATGECGRSSEFGLEALDVL